MQKDHKNLTKPHYCQPPRRENSVDIKNGFLVEFYPKLVGLPFLGAKKHGSYGQNKNFFTFKPFGKDATQSKI